MLIYTTPSAGLAVSLGARVTGGPSSRTSAVYPATGVVFVSSSMGLFAVHNGLNSKIPNIVPRLPKDFSIWGTGKKRGEPRQDCTEADEVALRRVSPGIAGYLVTNGQMEFGYFYFVGFEVRLWGSEIPLLRPKCYFQLMKIRTPWC
ncbi:uncharacterized protein LOC143357089 [Halictus rubicundus]|uniref:uncharacterized protein LOC143357089 n=1 Tax=Halictus rubicundus TaxID=77578 RepID=UPI0040366402